jgi:sigma-E factor negative regulatory protein RseB
LRGKLAQSNSKPNSPRKLVLNKVAAKLGLSTLLIFNFAIAQDPMDSPLDPKQLFMRMVEAGTREAYQGSMAFERSGQLTTYWVDNLTVTSGQQSLRSLNRAMPLRTHQIDCGAPGGNSMIDIDTLAGLYNFYRPGDSMVAGRPASELLLLPVDSFRYGYGFSLDAENYLTLRTVILTPQRAPIERYEFVSIEFSEASEETPDEKVKTDCPQLEARTEATWITARLPDGFKTINSTYLSDLDKSELVLTDGLATISITLEPIDAPRFPPVNTNLGATNILLSYLSVEQNIYLATLVGEVPLLSLELIALGLIPISNIAIQ